MSSTTFAGFPSRLWWLVIVMLMSNVSGGCFDSSHNSPPASQGADSGDVTVYAVNYPLTYFAQRIAGETPQVTVVFPVPSGVDPAFWKPSPEAIANYQQADLILLNGAGYAKWTGPVSLPQSALVDTSSAFDDQLIHVENAVTHQHGPQGEHSHAGVAFTTWLDLQLAIKQAQAIQEALVKKSPQIADVFQNNFSALKNDLQSLDDQLQDTFSPHQKTPLLASHPVYQYFARRYGLDLKSVLWEPDAYPSDKQWDELASLQKSHPAKWMLWEGTPQDETRRKLQSMGIGSIVFDPCGNAPERGDFLSVMQSNVENLKSTLAPE